MASVTPVSDELTDDARGGRSRGRRMLVGTRSLQWSCSPNCGFQMRISPCRSVRMATARTFETCPMPDLHEGLARCQTRTGCHQVGGAPFVLCSLGA